MWGEAVRAAVRSRGMMSSLRRIARLKPEFVTDNYLINKSSLARPAAVTSARTLPTGCR